MTPTIQLNKGNEKSINRRHPWIFSGAIDKVTGRPRSGTTVDVLDSNGIWMARGGFSPESKIRVRIWTFDQAEQPGAELFVKRLSHALAWRQKVGLTSDTDAYRWINGESDGFPGLTIDRYGDFVVCQFLSAPVEFFKQEILDAIQSVGNPVGIFERSDSDVRKMEGLEPRTGLCCGTEPPEIIEIREGSNRYPIDIRRGHKTGFYLDQRLNRARVARYATDAEVLNCFSYSGGFGVAALHAGARHVTHVDSSQPALELAVRAMALNDLATDRFTVDALDVFKALRGYRDSNRKFDLIILDPPKFAESRKQVADAGRAYKDINLLAMHLLHPGGILATFSCSGAMDRAAFQQAVAFAAMDAKRDALIMESLEQCGDHPYSTAFPEGFYLKGLILRME